jgi:O-antigen/teichoic acid export membrane protein
MNTRALIDPASRPAMLLVIGRSLGLATTFAIGIIFARLFDPADFGTYKQFFLVFATLYGVAQLGMAESLYYFVPRRGAETGRYVANAMLTLAIAGGLCLTLLYAGRFVIAGWFSNPELVSHLPILGLYLTLTLVTTVFEIVMVSRKHHMAAAVTYALSDVARTALFILPALVFLSLGAAFVGATAFAAIRLVVVFASFWREFGRDMRIDLALWRHQLAYALPFALAVSVEIIQINYHQYVVASNVDAATFAIYAIGCLQIPLVDLIMTSTVNVLMVRMAEEKSHGEAARALWHDTVERLAFLLVPLAVFLVVMARPLIIGLFTETYASSIPIFTVWALAAVLPGILAVDGVLRVYAQNKFLLITNVLRLGFVALFIGVFMSSFGLPGAVLVTLIGTMGVKLLGAARVASLMHIPLWQMLPWMRLAGITMRALVAAIPAWWIANHMALSPMVALIAGGAAYTTIYFGLAYLSMVAPRKGAPHNLDDAAPPDAVGRVFTARQATP